MSIWVILFANFALGQVSTIANFSSYVASQSEAFELNLYDYFAGPNLMFTINSTSSSNWNVVAANPFSFTPAAQVNFTGSTSESNLSRNLKVRKYMDWTSTNCIIAWYDLNITSYCVIDNMLVQAWTTIVSTALTNGYISDIALDPSLTHIYAVVSSTTGTKNVPIASVFVGTNFTTSTPPYFNTTTGYSLSGSNTFRIEVSSQYAAILNTTSNTPGSPGLISVYNISNPLNGVLVNTSNYSTYPVDLGFIDATTLVVAGSSIGLVKYSITNTTLELVETFEEQGVMSLDIVNTTGIVSIGNVLALVDLNAMEVDDFVYLLSSNGTNNATAAGGKLVGDYSFANTIVGNVSNLAIVNFDLDQDQGLVCNFNLSAYQTGQFNTYAPFTVFMNPDNTYSYVRVDGTLVSLVQLTVGSWYLVGFTNSTNYSANVTANVGTNPNLNATLTFTGTSVSPTQVVAYANNTLINDTIEYELETVSEFITLDAVVYPSRFFGGSYLNYSLSISTPANFSVSISQPQQKYNATMSLNTNNTLISAFGPIVALSDGTNLTAYNVSSQSKIISYQTSGSVSAIVLSNGGIVWYSSAYSSVAAAFPTSSSASISTLNCTQFKAYNGQVFCGNSSSITVLTFLPNYVSIDAYISNNTFNSATLNFSDFSFGTGVSGVETLDYMFLVTPSGLYSFGIDNLEGSLMLNGPFATTTDVLSVFTTEDQLVVVRTGGFVDIYSVNYGALPTLSSSIPVSTGIVSAAASETILALQYSTYTVIIDLYAEALNALYTSYNSSSSCSLAVYTTTMDSVLALCPASSSNYTSVINSTQIIGDRDDEVSPVLYPITISIVSLNPFIYSTMILITGNITAVNNYNASASLDFTVAVTNLSPYLVSNFNQTGLIVDYDVDKQISNLLQYFIGQDVDLSLNINGNYTTFDDSTFNYQPVVLYPKIYAIDEYANQTIVDIGVAGSNYTFALGPSNIYFLQYNSSEIMTVNTLNLTTSTNEYSCNSFDVYVVSTGVYQFFVNCNSTFTNGTITQTTGAEVYYTWESGVTYPIRTTTTGSIFEFTKAVPMSNSSFVVYQVTDNEYYDGEFDNTRFTASYFFYYNNVPGYNLNDYEYSYTDFALTSLKISAIDSYFVSLYQAVVYMADASGYIQVFNVTVDTSNNVHHSLIQSISTGAMVPVSIGVCGQQLFVGGYDEEVYAYNLTNNGLNVTFASYYYTTGLYSGTQGNIDCSADFNPQYVAVPLVLDDSGSFTTRVLDLYAANTSAVYVDLDYGYNASEGIVAFVNSDTIRGLSNSIIVDYEISVPYLDIQSLTQAQYTNITATYGTNNFTVFLTATNGAKTVNTTSFTLIRSVPANNNDDDDSALALYAAVLLGFVSLI